MNNLTNLSICKSNLTGRIDSDVTGILNPLGTDSSQTSNFSQANNITPTGTKANLLKPIELAIGGLLLAGAAVFGMSKIINQSQLGI